MFAIFNILCNCNVLTLFCLTDKTEYPEGYKALKIIKDASGKLN